MSQPQAHTYPGFPGGSTGKESACNARDPSSISGSERSPGKGIGDPSWNSWASLVAQMVKNPPAMQETWFRSLGWKMPWKRAWQPTPVFLAGEPQGQRSLAGSSPWGRRVGHNWATKNSTHTCPLPLELPSHLPPHPTPSTVTEHRFALPELYSRLPLAGCFTLVVYSFKEHQLDGNRLRCLLHVTEQDGQVNVPESTPSLLKAWPALGHDWLLGAGTRHAPGTRDFSLTPALAVISE